MKKGTYSFPVICFFILIDTLLHPKQNKKVTRTRSLFIKPEIQGVVPSLLFYCFSVFIFHHNSNNDTISPSVCVKLLSSGHKLQVNKCYANVIEI